MKYKVAMCPSCGNIQISSSNITFKCVRCNKSKSWLSKKNPGLQIKVIKSFDHPKDATNFISEYKRSLHER